MTSFIDNPLPDVCAIFMTTSLIQTQVFNISLCVTNAEARRVIAAAQFYNELHAYIFTTGEHDVVMRSVTSVCVSDCYALTVIALT